DRHADDPWREHLAGTPNYMAPEQIECRWRDYGPWTDLYAFGCLAWSLVTGVPPFAARDPREVLRSQVRKQPSPMDPEQLQSRDIPAGFEGWLLRLLEKDPGRRYQRAADAAWALMGLMEGHAPLSAEEAAPTSWQLPVMPRHDVVLDEVVAFGSARAFTWTVEDLSSVCESEPGSSMEVPPVPQSWRRPEKVEWQPLVGAGLGLFGLRAVPLIDRLAERDRLWRALRRVHRDGLPRAVVLRGAAGLGKSHLARWLCERAHEVGAATILRATHSAVGTPQDGLAAMMARLHHCEELPRAAVVDRMQRVLEELVPGDQARQTERAHLLAELITSGRSEFGTQMPRERRFSLLLEHLRMLGRKRPLVLVIEDAHWGEEAVEFCQQVLDAADDVRVLVVLTARTDEHGDTPASVEAVERHPAVERLTVGPMSAADMPELIHALLGLESEVAAEVEARCEGNPLFATQLVGDWVQRGVLVPGTLGFELRPGVKPGLPDGVHALWRQRIEAALPEQAHQHAIMLGALLGGNFEQSIWEKAVRSAGLGADAEVLQSLADRGLLRLEGTPTAPNWAFTHGMLQESLERQAGEDGFLKTAHLSCAEALAGEKKRPYQYNRAEHLLKGGAKSQAARVMIRAGHDLLEDNKKDEAEALLERWTALVHELNLPRDHPNRADARLLSCRIARARNDHRKMDMLARAALREGEEHGWPKVVGKALVDLAWAAIRAGDLDVAKARLATATEQARKRGDKFGLITTLRNQAQFLLDTGSFEEVSGMLDEVMALIGDRPLASAAALTQVARALLLRRHGRFDEAAIALDEAERHFQSDDLRWGLARVITERGSLALARGDVAAAIAFQEEAVKRLSVIDGPTAPWSRLNLGRARIAAGELAAARDIFEDELLLSRRKDHQAPALVAELGLLIIAALERDWRGWRNWLMAVRERLEERESTTRDAIAMTEQAAEAAVAAGSASRAAAAYAVAEAQWALLGIEPEVARVRALVERLRSL
ncbi:MAG: AAA family ATPase, partial [Myxococcales bacterium]|nr:AAA family ATPase [Myxococcales bacterium]